MVKEEKEMEDVFGNQTKGGLERRSFIPQNNGGWPI